MPGLYIDFNIPIEVRKLVEKMVNQRKSVTTPVQDIVLDEASRMWISQPRSYNDKKTEVIDIKFKLPLSVSTISVDVIRRPCKVDVFYKDRSNNLRPVLDQQRNPISLVVNGTNDAGTWYRWFNRCYPIVAKEIQFRVKRIYEYQSDAPYSVGIKNVLLKRNVFNRNDAVRSFETEQDVYGTVTNKYVRDWDASKAIDDDINTFWKSSPQPAPDAVVNFYMDMRNKDGLPQTVDKFYIDPVYKGGQVNLYYSNDDNIDARRISPINLFPTVSRNIFWNTRQGMYDTGVNSDSKYTIPAKWGSFTSQPCWVGIEWVPDFNNANAPAQNVILFGGKNTKIPVPTIDYRPAQNRFGISWQGGRFNSEAWVNLNKPIVKGQPITVVAGWWFTKGGNPTMYIEARNTKGEVLCKTQPSRDFFPETYTFDPQINIEQISGAIKNIVVKLEDPRGKVEEFFKNPSFYTSPDPVLPVDSGQQPTSTLDNAIYAAAFTEQEHGIGGRDYTEYTGKKWTPVWRDYFVEKGFLYLPEPISAKYFKFEFTNLTPEPYPIYEPGIEVEYQVYPVKVEQESTQGLRINFGSNVGGFFNVLNLNGINHFNIFNANSWKDSIQKLFGKTYKPVVLEVQKGYNTTAIPNTLVKPIVNQTRVELSSTILNRREELSAHIMAQNEDYVTVKSDGLIRIEPYTNIPWKAIADANPGALQRNPAPGLLPVRGADYWVFPGQQLKIPAHVMKGITATETSTELRAASTNRVRFIAHSVHKYEKRVVKRDAMIAYFAGIREITPFMSSFIEQEDRDVIDFPKYMSPPWSISNMSTNDLGVTQVTRDVGSATFSFKTQSQFNKIRFDFRDSGYQRSDDMWNSEDDTKLSYNTTITRPDGATWNDFVSNWGDTRTDWGSAQGLVAMSIDTDRLYQGKRVLRVSRASGAGNAVIKIRQTNHYLDTTNTVRVRAKYFQPVASTNEIIVKLYPKDDAKNVIYKESLPTNPGEWHDFVSKPFTVAVEGKKEFVLEFSMSGNDQNEVFINDVYTEVSHIKYFFVPGKTTDIVAEDLREVTTLRDNPENSCFVSPVPINEGTIIVQNNSKTQYLYGMSIKPVYLQ